MTHSDNDELLPVVTVSLFDRAEIEGLVMSALDGSMALVPVTELLPEEGTLILELVSPDRPRPVVLAAELAGEPSDGICPMFLKPIDAANADELLAFLSRESLASGDLPPVRSDRPLAQVRILTPRSTRLPAEPALPPRKGKSPITLPSLPPVTEAQDVVPSVEVIDRGGDQRPTEPPVTVPRPEDDRVTMEVESATISSIPQSVTNDPLLGRTIGGGKYLIQTLLGAGGAGSVYRAHQVMLQKDIAIKVMHPSLRKDPTFGERFHSEALAASKLDHPNVLRVIDFGEEPDGLLYIAMELLVGTELRALMWQGKLPLERLLDITAQICAALSAASEVGIVHRDIKPENVVITTSRDDEGNLVDLVKVCDFGLATIAQPDTDEAEQRSTEIIAGTPEYMSPEQVRGEELDGRSDIYAVGVLLYELVTGKLPFEGQSPITILKGHLNTPVTPPSKVAKDVDPEVEAVILRALAKDREQRPETAREMRAELRNVLDRIRRKQQIEETPQQSVVPIEDSASGFGELFVALTAAVARTTYYERDHPEFARSLVRVIHAARTALTGRGEITIAQRDIRDAELVIQTGAGEVLDLRRALPGGVAEAYAPRFAEVYQRRHVVSLTLKEGVSDADLADATELLSGPEVAVDALRLDFLSRGLSGVSILFTEELLGKSRKLPWHVDLCISRLARDLRALPLLRGVAEDTMRSLRLQLVGDVVRNLERPDDLRLLLQNTDLVSTSVQHIPELGSLDFRSVIVSAVRRPLAISTASYLVTAAGGGGGLVPPPAPAPILSSSPPFPSSPLLSPVPPGSQAPILSPVPPISGAPSLTSVPSMPMPSAPSPSGPSGAPEPRITSPVRYGSDFRLTSEMAKELLSPLASRFLRERSPETDDLLRAMVGVDALDVNDLPHELQVAVAAERLAADTAADPEIIVRRLRAAPNLTRYAEEILATSRALVVLARAGDAKTVAAVLADLTAIARGASPDDTTKEGLAASAVSALGDDTALAALADALLFGPVPHRDPARQVLAMVGAPAARALLALRTTRGSSGDPFPRPRFVGALREVGRPAIAAIAEQLSRLDPDGLEPGSDPTFAEDLLRSIPDAQDEALGRVVARFLRHHAAPVRRAAASSLPALLARRAKLSLTHSLDDIDEGVRTAAMAGLRAIKAIDEDVVARLEPVLTGSTPASDELRAGAAGVLADVSPAAKARAIEILLQTIRPKPRSLVSLFKADTDNESPLLLTTVARVLLAIGGVGGRREVEKRANASRGELKKQLIELLTVRT